MTGVSDVYTSIATGGLADELAQEILWDKAVKWALREMPTARTFVSVRPEAPMARAQSTTLEKVNWFDNTTVAAMKTPLSEESDVAAVAAPEATPVVITPREYGGAVTRTKFFKERSFAQVDPLIAQQIAQVMGEVIDSLVQDALIADSTATYAGTGNSGSDDLANTDVLTAALVRRAVTRLRTKKVPAWFGNFYAGLVHPHVILDLREEEGAGSWRVPNEYGVSQGRIWTGEVGEFEGVRFVENALVRAEANEADTPATVYQNYFLGRGALAEQVYDEPHVVIAPPVDKLHRFYTIGWLADIGWKLYEPLALQRIECGSSLGDDLIEDES